jgi:hypothetical protein
MKTNRRFKKLYKKRNPLMREIKFPAETYVEKDNSELIEQAKAQNIPVKLKKWLECDNEFKCGKLELIDVMISKMSELKMDKKKHKVNKKLRAKFKDITRYKDEDKDARVTLDGAQTLVLEDAEYDLLKEHMDSATPKMAARISDLLTDVWDLVDEAREFKLELAKSEG